MADSQTLASCRTRSQMATSRSTSNSFNIPGISRGAPSLHGEQLLTCSQVCYLCWPLWLPPVLLQAPFAEPV